MSRRLFAVLLFLVAFLLSFSCKRAPSDNIAAEVNNQPITYAELDKQYQMQFPSPAAETSEDQVAIQKLEVLRSMIDGEIMRQRAEKLGLMATDNDVEAKFNEMKAPYTKEEFQKQLDARKITVDELRAQLRRDLSIQKLLNKEITSHISITDKDVSDFYESNKASFNLAEPQVHMAQILVTPSPDPSVRNLKGLLPRPRRKLSLEQMEAAIGQGMVGCITVIDAEMDSVRLFKQFDEAQRGFVTILKGSMLQGDKRIFNQTNFRSYRQGDRIKEGRLDLNDPDGGKYRTQAGPHFLLSKTRFDVRRAPRLGEHNEYVFKGILGLSDAEFDQLVKEGVID